MPSSYPGAIQLMLNPGATLQGPPEHDDIEILQNDTITAIQTELGTTPKGSAASVRARLEEIEAGTRISALAATKLTGNFNTVTTPGDVNATGVVRADAYIRPGSDSPNIRFAQTTGTLDANGQGTVAHGVGQGNLRIIMVAAQWQGAGSEANNITGLTWDGTNLFLTGGSGSGSRKFRACWWYRETAEAW